MKILLVYPGTKHSTYDVAIGYHEALQELGHQVIAYPFHDYIDYHDGALAYWRKVNPKFNPTREAMEESKMRWASENLIIYVVEHTPELILIISGMSLHAHTYDLLAKFRMAKKAIILTESPYIDDKQKLILSHGNMDLAFTNEKNSVGPLTEMSNMPIVYLPHSYSPGRHFPAIADERHQTDIYFHGTWFPEREEIFSHLNGNYKKRIVGVGWEMGQGHTQYSCDNAELVDYYRGTKIALNHHRITGTIGTEETIADGIAWSIGPRAYEIAACGAFQLCDNTRPELCEIFGDSVATYSDADDLQAKIDYYLAHERERREMAKEALSHVLPCNFVNRAEQILLPAVRDL